MELRAYRPEDCPAMGALFYDTVHTVYTGEYDSRQLDAWAPPEGVDLAAWNESFSAHVTLVAVEDGTVVGFGDMARTGIWTGSMWPAPICAGEWPPPCAPPWNRRCLLSGTPPTHPAPPSPFSWPGAGRW